MKKYITHAQWEAAKEVARLALMGAVGAIIAWLTDLDQSTTVVVVTFVLRYVDKWLHKSENTELKGLVPF